MKQLKLTFVLIMLMSMVGIKANAHDFATGGFYYRYIDNQTAVAVTYRGDGNEDYNGTVYSGSLTIPKSVKFNGITYPVKSIDGWAFSDCPNLTRITIQNSVTSIGNSAFENCTSLSTISIPTTVTSIGGNAFKNTPWFNNKSDGVIYINNMLYTYKGTLLNQSISVKSGTLSICGSAFYGCSGLTSITIPNSVTTIGPDAFYGCTGLTSVDLSNSLINIEPGAFENCTGLTSITLPSSLITIGANAFRDCTNLWDITLPNSVTTIGKFAFSHTGLDHIVIPSSVTSIGLCAFASGGITSISVEPGNAIYDSRDNCNAIIETASNTMIKGCSHTIIPNSVTKLYGAFCNCALMSIDIPNSVTEIGDYTFYHSSLYPDFVVPNSVELIGYKAFGNCGGLQSITIPSSVFSISSYAFAECNNLATVTVERTNPPGLGPYAFVQDTYNNPHTLYVPAGRRVDYANSSWSQYFRSIQEYQESKDLNSSDITIDPIAAATYSGNEQTPAVTVKDGNTVLTYLTDFTLSYSSNINAGTAAVTITGMGNYTGTRVVNFTINPKNASNLTINSISAVTYNGSAQTPTVTVKDGSTTLTSGTHYTVSYSNNTNAGTATATITGKGNYTGTKSANFTINPKNASSLTINSIAAVTYTGSAQTPAITVNDGTTTLISGTDYTTSYWSNTDAGTATVQINGKGNYSGWKSAHFTINPKDASNLTINSISAVTYTGSAQTPTVTVKDGSTTLTNNTHYIVFYSNNTNAGTATVTITGRDNYTGTKSANFTINPKNASNLTISSIAAVTYNGSAQTPTVTVKDGSTTLTNGTHYTVAYINNTNAGTATVTITGMGNYTGTKNANFTINPMNASSLTINSIAAQTYSGSAKTPTVTVKDGSTTLTSGTHYTVSYSNNTNAGTATVTVSGKGNYTGTKNASFTIQKAPLTITAKSYTIDQYADLPAFEVEYSGFVNGEDESVLITQPLLTCDADNSETVGTYDITPSGASATNYSFSYVKGTLTVNAVDNITIAMNAGAGKPRSMVGYSSKFGLDFTGITGIKAYIVCGYNFKKEAMLVHVDVVPPYTGFVIKTTNSIYDGEEFVVPTCTDDYYYANLLLPVVESQTIQPTETIDDVEYTNLMVGILNNEKPGFVRLTEPVVRHNKSYLRVPTSLYNSSASARQLGGISMVFEDDEATGISNLNDNVNDNVDANAPRYNIAGQRVDAGYKGVVIQNGKKILIK